MKMKDWYDIYRDRMNNQYREHVAARYAPFLEQLHEHQREVTTEIGCGAGNITRLLREMEAPRLKRYHHLTDRCPRMLSLAIENNPVPTVNFSCTDIFESVPSNCDLIHSHGLLEHFHDMSIQRLVHNMTFAAPVQLHYVPGAKYQTPSRGDERLLEPDHWKEILSCFRKVKVTTFNEGFDIILRIER